MAEEKILTINLRKKLIKNSRWRRAKDCSIFFRETLEKKFKTDKIKIDKKVNEKIWERGIENPPCKLRVKSIKSDDGTVKIELME
jgi:large subunit ribosomal protein L31e